MCVLITAVPITKQGDFSKAITHHSQDLSIAKEVVDRAGEGRAYGNLDTCHVHLSEYVKADAYLKAHHVLAMSLKLGHLPSVSEINMVVALTLHVRAGRQSPAATDDDQDSIVTRLHWRA